MRVGIPLLLLVLALPVLPAAPIVSPNPGICHPPCAAPGALQWSVGHSVLNTSVLATAVEPARDCGSYVAGYLNSLQSGGPSTPYLERFDCKGTMRWRVDLATTLGGTDPIFTDLATATETPPVSIAIGVDALDEVFQPTDPEDEAAYVVGIMDDGLGIRQQSFLIRFDEEGAPVCTATLADPTRDVLVSHVTASPDGGGVLALGWSPSTNENYVIRLDATCTERWRLVDERLESPRHISAALVDNEVHVYVTTSWQLVRLTCSNPCLTPAEISWVNTLDGMSPEVALALPEGGAWVGGAEASKAVVQRIGAGNEAGARIPLTNTTGNVFGLARRLDGGLYVSGIEYRSGSAMDAFLLATRPDATPRWRKHVASPTDWFHDIGVGVATATNGDALFLAKTWRWPDANSTVQAVHQRYCP